MEIAQAVGYLFVPNTVGLGTRQNGAESLPQLRSSRRGRLGRVFKLDLLF
jgi:hypothetical protein